MSPNDSVPSGTLVGHDSFPAGSGVSNGVSVSGNVEIYNQGSGTYTVRLATLNVDTTISGIQLRIYVNGSTFTKSYSLRAYTGNQNYTITGLSSLTLATWTIQIYDPTANLVYGEVAIKATG